MKVCVLAVGVYPDGCACLCEWEVWVEGLWGADLMIVVIAAVGAVVVVVVVADLIVVAVVTALLEKTDPSQTVPVPASCGPLAQGLPSLAFHLSHFAVGART